MGVWPFDREEDEDDEDDEHEGSDPKAGEDADEVEPVDWVVWEDDWEAMTLFRGFVATARFVAEHPGATREQVVQAVDRGEGRVWWFLRELCQMDLATVEHREDERVYRGTDALEERLDATDADGD